jgi:hypothetical protein
MDRISAIKEFHYNIYQLQNSALFDLSQCSPEWGLYPPSHIWNADHVPLPFCVNLKRSLNPKGEPCWIAVAGPSGLDKRQATIHPCIRADGDQVMPIFIIFRGGGNITPQEADYLDSLPNIRWAFQDNAWADSKYSRAWLRLFCEEAQRASPGEHLLFLDYPSNISLIDPTTFSSSD